MADKDVLLASVSMAEGSTSPSLGSPILLISPSVPGLVGSKETPFAVGCGDRTTERAEQRWEEVRSTVPQGQRE